MDATDDRLPASALEGIDLPPATLSTLSTMGVPRELRLPEWPGPTLFHSELHDGRLVSTAEPGALVARTGEHEGYVIGSVRDITGAMDAPYSVFCLRRGKGDVWLLDLSDPADDRFVNSSLDSFLACMEAFHTAFPRFGGDGPERDGIVASFATLIGRLDPEALTDEEHYWPGWLAEIE